jgi:hypothetical protein
VNIEPHKDKNFHKIEITSKDFTEKEVLNISLTRNKTPQEKAKQKLQLGNKRPPSSTQAT